MEPTNQQASFTPEDRNALFRLIYEFLQQRGFVPNRSDTFAGQLRETIAYLTGSDEGVERFESVDTISYDVFDIKDADLFLKVIVQFDFDLGLKVVTEERVAHLRGILNELIENAEGFNLVMLIQFGLCKKSQFALADPVGA